MWLQLDLLKQAGVSPVVARKLLEERIREVERKILPQNHTRSVDAARLLKMPFLCMHTPADNHVFSFLKKLMQQKKPKRLKDIVRIINEIPEYKDALRNKTGSARILLGSEHKEAGKILFEMTGGTEGSKDVFERLYKAGVRTLVNMHLSEEHLKKAKEANLNVVIAGHISSDTLGLNLLLDKIEKEELLEVFGCSGFKRIRRI
jgi:putative NIF3 family GTP cyclohydrolase 1 type 2